MKLSASEAARICGLTLTTWRTYVSIGYAPRPDGYTDHTNRRTPYWTDTTILEWNHNR